MKVGDRARDRASGFTGTVIGLDTASDQTLRVLIEADRSEEDDKPENFGKPPKLWTAVASAELLDADGKVVVGKSSKEIDTEGRQVAAAPETGDAQIDSDKRAEDLAASRDADRRKALEAKSPNAPRAAR